MDPNGITGQGNYDPGQIAQAYHLASVNNDTEAMQELDGMLRSAYQKQNATMGDPTAGNSFGQNLVEGTGRGLERFTKGAANLVGIRSNALGTTNQDLEEEDKLDKPLLQTGGGAIGNVLGQTVATLPLGMGSGALLRGVEGLGVRAAGLATPRARLLINALRAAGAGGENALQSAATGDPNDKASSAEEGALWGVGLHGLGKLGGKLVRGVVEKSEPATDLYREAQSQGHDLFVPISQGASDEGATNKTAKLIYQSVLPYALGVEGKLEGQSKQGAKVVRDVMAERGMPVQEDATGTMTRQHAPIGLTTEQTAEDTRKAYSKLYDSTVGGYAFKVPQDFRDRVVANLKAEHPDIPDSIADRIGTITDSEMQKYGKGGTISGSNLQEASASARAELDKAISNNEFRNPQQRETALQSFKDVVDDAIDEHRDIINTSKNPKDVAAAKEVVRNLRNYQRLPEAYKETAPWVEGAEGAAAKRGAFNFGKVAQNSDPNTNLHKMAQDASEVFEQESPGAVNPSGRHFAHTMARFGEVAAPITALGFGHPVAAAALAGAIPAANFAASRGFQRGLYGDLAPQKFLASLLRKYPQTAYSVGAAGRSAVNAARQ